MNEKKDVIEYSAFDLMTAELLKGQPVLISENSTGIVYEVVAVSGDFILVTDGDGGYIGMEPDEYETLVRKE